MEPYIRENETLQYQPIGNPIQKETKEKKQTKTIKEPKEKKI